jgi:EpsI family protein
MSAARGWAPAAVLAAGALLATVGVTAQRSLPLRLPLAEAVPARIAGLGSREITLSGAEARVAGVTSYLARNYQAADTAKTPAFSVYVGYYAAQAQGQTIHSPKNCLPGAGWEPLTSQPERLVIAGGAVTVNRYLIQKGQERALVFYWYQGRGRVAWNEYRVKWDLLRDAAIRRRSDEALVRIVVPIRSSEAAALQTATAAAAAFVPALMRALPA